ncbi:cyclopropane-fatty-acyl-phospholipid synthase [Monaibacterium marinum]|uniref:Cyclopropane-fatty-acyl-phospholipid synthase n=1 Tax=Pontivivens marinum TaxID=1690039 RepID=A0A2C9CW38_9RHOB|nr:cyclopropane-fatty-acyl-phospholipid synthase family protein [Monaibacterium marinum]SOH95325.1 cyclopropane-fatty-acyl-phospholipid synthase [Monaibacterium marinum]
MTYLTTTSGQSDLPRWFAQGYAILSNIQAGTVDMVLPDGRVFRAQGDEAGPYGRIDVRDPAMFARVVRDGEIGFSEAFMDGHWDTPDLQALMDVLLLNNDVIGRNAPGVALVRMWERMNHWLRRNSKDQARRNISYHYDLGNEFYGLWLDDTMSYSSALFTDNQMSLENAQIAKYASMCDELGVQSGDHVLEIGCGWGGFAEYAAKERGARVTGLTISQQQHDYAVDRIARAGLSDQVEIVMRDYRDETGIYDCIASIEMFEAVGEQYWPTYFDAVRERLKPGGRGTFQIITIADRLFPEYRKSVDFIQKYIFPGGMLPSATALREQITRAGLTEVGNIEIGQSYSETLRRWHETFNAKWDDVAAMGFDDRFRRMWNFYLTSCAATFRYETTDVVQMTVRR